MVFGGGLILDTGLSGFEEINLSKPNIGVSDIGVRVLYPQINNLPVMRFHI
jgi:hypothetical protein